MPTPTNEPDQRPADAPATIAVPWSLRVAAAWAWRLIVVGVVVWVLFHGFTTLASVVLPLIIALLIAAPLERLVTRLNGWRVPRAAGALAAILGLLLVIAGLGAAASGAVVADFEGLRVAAVTGFDTFLTWLVDGPAHLSREQIDVYLGNIGKLIEDNAWGLATGAFSVTGAIGALLAGSLIALFALFFFLKDGRSLWLWVVRMFPTGRAERIDGAGVAAWGTLRRYTQTSVFVAFIDAVGIGVGAWLLGIPLALPIGIFVFLLSFIPLFGATLSGAIAVLVALVDGGWVTAVWMLVIVLAVQQIEGNLLYPWLFGRAVALHPLAILLAVTTGTLLLGLIGAVIAVPIVSFVYAFGRSLHAQQRGEPEPPPETGSLHVLTEQPKVVIQRAREVIARTGEIRVRRRGRASATDTDGNAPVDSADAPGTSPDNAPGR